MTPPSGSLSIRQVLCSLQITWYAGLGLIGFLAWLILYRLVLYPRFFSPLREIPGPPLGNALLGQFLTAMRGEPGIPQRQWIKEYGPVVRVVGPFGAETLIFAKPEALQKILATACLNYPIPGYTRRSLWFLIGNGLLVATGKEHKRMRRIVNPAFSIPNIMAQTDMYHEPIKGLLNILQNQIGSSENPGTGTVIKMFEWMSKVTLDILCQTAFGYTVDSLHNPHNDLANAYEKLLSLQSGSSLALVMFVFSIPGTSTFFASEWAYGYRYLLRWIPGGGVIQSTVENMHKINQIASEILKERMDESSLLTSGGETKRDVMSLLGRARQRALDQPGGESSLTDHDMVQQMLTFLGAGHATIASGLAWTLWFLANDVQSQIKLREEVKHLFTDHARPDFRSLQELSWLDCVIMESLRVLPPTPTTFRTAIKTDTIDGVLVPEGTHICIPTRAVNTWKEIWGEDAEDFKPARWLDLTPDSKQGFFTFIIGPKACIGKTMAIMEMKAVIAALITKFDFRPAFDGQEIHPTATSIMTPSDGLPLRVRAIENLS